MKEVFLPQHSQGYSQEIKKFRQSNEIIDGTGDSGNNYNKRVDPIDVIELSNEARYFIRCAGEKQVKLLYSDINKKVSARVITETGHEIPVNNENVPKELQSISTTEAFTAYVKNAYAKISKLSDGGYKLTSATVIEVNKKSA